jgi:CubicO group peptidase (beta-lactamase class C family)
MIHGREAPGFEGVRAAFEENFASRGEVGAAFAVTIDGQSVIDLWGGMADREAIEPWRNDTLAVIFSGTKGLAALCLLMLVDRGQLALEAPVRWYWPEFAAAGKENVTVAEVASHQARLPGVRIPLADADILDGARMAALLASQPQESDDRAAAVYHALTYGWLCGELVRRVDGRSIGQFFAEEVAGPLGLEAWIGLPSAQEERVAALYYAHDWGAASGWTEATFARDDLLRVVWNNPAIFPPGEIPWNRAERHQAEIAGAGGIATARSMARLYGCLARGGELDGVQLLSAEALEAGRREREKRWEPLLQEPQAFGVGFQLQTNRRVFGPAPDAFGHPGAGGSVHCAWPSERLGLSYIMNLMRDDSTTDPRAQSLLVALDEALHARSKD